MTILESYQQALVTKGYEPDAAQEAAVASFQRLTDELHEYHGAKASLVKRWFSRPTPPKGIYLWGGVGRGKSFLMDLFYQSISIEKKIRLHFHEFMRGVHDALKELKSQADPLESVAKDLSQRYELICFDEFHVSDIADAMILHHLLDALMRHEVCFVMTSNYAPDALYPDGLHRERLLPAIELIKDRMEVLNVDAGVDYRIRSENLEKVFFHPHDEHAQAQLARLFRHLSGGHCLEPTIEIENRSVQSIKRSAEVIWFDFATLCETPRSQNDYLDLARQYKYVIVSGVPKLSAAQASAARRFTWLVDVFYDHNVRLLLSAEVKPEELYTQGPFANEFSRTVSRLHEMQTHAYLHSKQREIATF